MHHTRHAAALFALLAALVTALLLGSIPLAAQDARVFVLPYLGSAPETGLQYGATAFRVARPADGETRPSTAQLFASYTAKRQARAFVELDRWSRANRWHTIAHLEWARTPLLFYGFGDRADESAEEVYTPRGVVAALQLQRRVAGAVYLVGGYRFQDFRVATDPLGALASGGVRGATGGRVGQLQAGVQRDDRDDVFAPHRGSFVQATASLAGHGAGSDYAFRRLVVDARRFVPSGADRTLALQLVSETTAGDAPFDQLSLVGGSSYLRGYARGRYRDRDLLSAQAEYRAPLWRRLGWTAFAGAGRIAPRPGGLFAGSARTLPSYGVGLRRTLFAGSRSDIRVDYARGLAGQSGVYVALNEAF